MRYLRPFFVLLFAIATLSVAGQSIVTGQRGCTDSYKGYTPSYQVPLYGYGDSLDLNGDGVKDFVLLAQSYTFMGGMAYNAYAQISPLGMNEIVYGHTDSSFSTGCNSAYNIPKEFLPGQVIGTAENWQHKTMVFSASSSNPYYQCYSYTSGIAGSNKYIGVRILTPIDTLYCWIHFEQVGGGNIKLQEYACNLHNDQTGFYTDISDIQVQCGNPVLFRISPRSISCCSYQWFKNNTAIPGATSDSLYIAHAVKADSGQYTCRVINSFVDTFFCNTAQLSVQTSYSFQLSSGPTVLCEYDQSFLQVDNITVSNVSIQWLKDGVAIPGATAGLLVLDSLVASNTGIYVCRVIDYCSDTMYSPERWLWVKTTPVPTITRTGNILMSDYTTGNIWMIKDPTGVYNLVGNGQSITMTQDGIYALQVAPEGCYNYPPVEYNATMEVIVHPNPVVDVLTLTVNNDRVNNKWELANDLGMIVLEGWITYQVTTIDISGLGSGSYFLRVKDKVVKVIKR